MIADANRTPQIYPEVVDPEAKPEPFRYENNIGKEKKKKEESKEESKSFFDFLNFGESSEKPVNYKTAVRNLNRQSLNEYK